MYPRASSFESVVRQKLVSPWGPEVELSAQRWSDTPAGPVREDPLPDLRVALRWGGREFLFAVEAKGRSTPAVVEQASRRATQLAARFGLAPMVIVPYLAERTLDALAARGVSGIDLSGNGVAVVPGVLYLRSTGQPNRFPESQPARFAYRGATSVVPRTFLCRRSFPNVNAIKAEIEARGGEVALSTVSKALARMTEDLIVRRTKDSIALMQADVLLDKLRERFEEPKRMAVVGLKCDDLPGLFRRVNPPSGALRLVMSGVASQQRYTAGRRTDRPMAWCIDLPEVRSRAGEAWRESERFADIEIVQTKEVTPFFDARRDETGVGFASPVQAYLELAEGDKRDQEAAVEIRNSILSSIG